MKGRLPVLHPSWGIFITAALLWVFSYFGARVLLESFTFTPALRILIVLTPLLPFGWFLWMIISGIRSLDELQRRVHLEALSIAYPLAILLLMTLGLLELTVKLSPDDWSYRNVWAFLPGFYFFGLWTSWRKYA